MSLLDRSCGKRTEIACIRERVHSFFGKFVAGDEVEVDKLFDQAGGEFESYWRWDADASMPPGDGSRLLFPQIIGSGQGQSQHRGFTEILAGQTSENWAHSALLFCFFFSFCGVHVFSILIQAPQLPLPDLYKGRSRTTVSF